MKQSAVRSAFIRIAVVILSLVHPVALSAQYQMVVHTYDGMSYMFNTDSIESVSFVLNSGDDGTNSGLSTSTGFASEITNNSAKITATAIIPDSTSTNLNVGIIYTNTGTPSKNNGTQMTVSLSSLANDGKYSVKLKDLTPSTIYYYCSFISQNGTWLYGDVKEFTTMSKPNDPTPGGGEGIGGGEYD